MLHRISDHIFYSPAVADIDQPCLYAVVGSEKTLMIDGGISEERAMAFVDELKEQTGRGADFIAVTHWHWDHVFGLDGLDMPLIGHRRLSGNLERLRTLTGSHEAMDRAVQSGQFTAVSAANIKKSYSKLKIPVLKSPHIAFDGTLRIDLGGLVCDLIELPGCHTDDSIAIDIPQQSTFIVADGLYPYFRNGTYRYYASSVLALLQRIRDSKAAHILDSHMEPMDTRRFDSHVSLLETAAQGIGIGISDKKGLLEHIRSRIGNIQSDELNEMADLFLNGLKGNQEHA